MSYPELPTEAVNECSRAAFNYSPDCYCVFNWSYADYLPRRLYLDTPTKWLNVGVYRSIESESTDRPVVAVSGLTAPELLQRLRTALAAITTGEKPDPSLPARHEPPRRFQCRTPQNLRKPIGFLTAAQRAEAQDRIP